MSTYQLKIHTRDLAVIGGKLVSHSGYDLIETKSDKSVIVHSLDLMNYNGKIYITQTTGQAIEWPENKFPIQYWPEKIFFGDLTNINTPNKEVDIELIENYHFSQNNLISGPDAKIIFDKIRFDAEFRNALANVDDGLIDYDPLGPNCNTWTNYVAKKYLDTDILSNLTGNFPGKDMPFNSNTIGGADNRNCKLIEDISDNFFAKYSEGFDMNNFKITLKDALDTDNKENNGFYAIITDGLKTYIFDGNRGSWFEDDDGNYINGTNANDYIIAGKGNDNISSGYGNDIIDAGAVEKVTQAVKTVDLGSGNDVYVGGVAKDNVKSSSGNNQVYLGKGNDSYSGGNGNDIVDGGSGDLIRIRQELKELGFIGVNDIVFDMQNDSTEDINTIHLGGGNDKYTGGQGKDYVWSGSGDDEINTGAGDDVVYTTDGEETDTNTVNLGSGNDEFHGGAGKDIVNSGSGSNIIHTGAGRDEVNTTAANEGDLNKVYLGAGGDTFEGGKGRDIVDGGVADSGEYDINEVRLGGGNDEYYGGAGIDKVHGGNGDDYISGGANADFLYGDGGNDIIDGGEGDNELYGGTGNDKIYAGSGNDTIKAGTGADYISAGGGINHIYLGKDNASDTVYLRNITGGVDHIYQSTQGDYIFSAYSYTVQEDGKNLVYNLSNGSKAILYDVLDKEDPDDPDSPNPLGGNGIPYLVDPDGNVLEYDPTTKQMKDTGYDVPKNQCPIPGKKPIPGDETPADLLPPDTYDKEPTGESESQYQDPNNEPGKLGKPTDTTPLGVKGDDLSRPMFPGSGLWTPLDSNFETGEVTKSPLILDLNGDGVKTTSKENGVYFDHENDGFAERTGWVSAEDGLLVYDRNNNGKIDNGTELFGDNTLLADGSKAENGFEALKEFDSNKDGILDQNDADWYKLQIWQDKNQNGRTDAGELKSLDETGVKSIDLNYSETQLTDSNNNAQKQTSTVTMADGSTANIIDIWFDTHTVDSQQTNYIGVSDDAKALPEVYGFGKVYSLRQAMSMDETGELKSLVEQYVNFSYYTTVESETSGEETSDSSDNPEFSWGVVVPPIQVMKPNAEEERTQLLYDIIYHWAGVQDMPINGRDPTRTYGKVIDDTRKLEAPEEFLGKDFLGTWCWGERDPNPHGKAAPYILRAFDMLATYVENQLLKQSDYKKLLQNISVSHNDTTNEDVIDINKMLPLLREKYNNNCSREDQLMAKFAQIIKEFENGDSIIAAIRQQGSLTGTAFEQALAEFGDLKGTAGADKLIGTSGVDYINGLAGNDTIYASDGNDEINGGDGNDTIFAEDGDDTLIGGSGNDYLNGGNGADTYIFEKGFGKDELDNSSENDEGGANNQDVIKFGEGILPEKTTLQRQNFDLIINVTYDDTTLGTDTLRILGYFDQEGQTNATIGKIEFADETVWDYEYVLAHWNSMPSLGGGRTFEGTSGNDNLQGTNKDDVLIGKAGDDRLYGNDGNDTLQGGTGNDRLEGGNGDDRYLWNWGDGLDTIYDNNNRDTIIFGNGISYKDITYRNEGNNLRIIVKGNEGQGLLLERFFNNGLQYKIEDLKFQDGKVIHLSEIPLTLHQKDTSETIYGTDKNDTIYANGGNDIVIGDKGNDTLYGGDGNDSIYGDDKGNYWQNVGNDTLIGGKGNDYLSGGYGNDTYIYNFGDGLDTIYDTNGTDKIIFGEGIEIENISYRAEGNNLRMILNGDEKQGIIINNFFNGNDYKIETLEFADGSEVAFNQIGFELQQNNQTNGLNTTNYNDIIHLFDTPSNNVNVGAGNDVAYGGAYNDTIIGHTGNDILYGGSGDDTIYGDNDTSSYKYVGNDTLIGGKGNDYLAGGYGDDTYVYNLGDGLDIIYDTNGIDTLKLGEGISLENFTYRTEGNNLRMILNGEETQGLIIQDYFSGKPIENIELSDGTIIDFTKIGFELNQNNLTNNLTTTNNDDIIHLAPDYNNINTSGGNDTVYGNIFADTIDGGAGDDVVYGNDGNDKLIGHTGNDTLYGGAGNDTIYGDNESSSYKYVGNDTLIGGTGDDYLAGGYGDDSYIYNLGDGLDTIYDNNGTDKIIFGEGIEFENISYRAEGNNLRMILKGDENQGIIINNFFGSDDYKIETLEFADGSTVAFNQIGFELHQNNRTNELTTTSFDDTVHLSNTPSNSVNMGAGNDTVYGGSYNDTITGHTGNDTLYGGAGNDTIYGDNESSSYKYVGNDTLIGGTGDDYLAGGYGDDSYIYNLGDGLDTIYDNNGTDKIIFGEGIEFENISYRAEGNNLRMILNEDENQGIIINNFFGSDDYKIETLEFADGSTVAFNQMGFELHQNNLTNGLVTTIYDDTVHLFNVSGNKISGGKGNDTIYGGSGNDTIYGDDETSSKYTVGNDTLIGGTGDDYLAGGYGDDSYIYNLGDGLDTIYDNNGTDKIIFGEGIEFENISYRAEGNNLRMILNGEENQGIIINNFFSSDDYKIETLEFADGSTVAFNQMGFELHQNNLTNGLVTTIYDDTIHLFDANGNKVSGGKGDDVIYGGISNDIIYGDDDTSSKYTVGNDTLVGGKGNDYLAGGYGNDTYIYNLGDGLDTIYDVTGTDTLKFGEGITSDSFTYRAEGNNLRMILNNEETQGIIIQDYFNGKPVENIELSDGTIIDLTTKGFELHQNNQTNGLNTTNYDDIVHLFDTPSNSVNVGAGNDTVYGGAYNDKVIGGMGDDILAGGSGKDTIYGDDEISSKYTVGNDTLIGGKGNDYLAGGYGNDTYIYNLGDSLDTIYDTNGVDKIKFGEGITLDNFTYRAEGNNLRMILNGDENQGFIIQDYFSGKPIENIELSDGTIIDFTKVGFELNQNKISSNLTLTNNDDIIHLAPDYNNINTAGGNDTVYGNIFADTIDGGAGDDVIYGDDGKDTLIGNTGNDILYGNNGNDTLYGDDRDSSKYTVGNDTLVGGKGNDYLAGGYGDDTYVYNLNDGFDTIYDTKGNDKIVFGDGINAAMLSLEQSGNNLRILVNNDKDQGIQINEYFNNANCRVESIELADGRTIDISNADQLIQAMNTFGLSHSATTESLSCTAENISDMGNLAVNDLNKKAV